MAQEMITVKHDCRIPRDGILKVHLGLDFQGQGWFFEQSGGGNIAEIAGFMLAKRLQGTAAFKEYYMQIAQYLANMPEPDIMWMPVYGDKIKYFQKDITWDTPLPRYYGLSFRDNRLVPVGFGLCLEPGTFGFEGHFLPDGNPQTGVVCIYGGMAEAGQIYAFNVNEDPLKINGKQSFSYKPGESFKIEMVEEM